tara:strand:- start:268 stop:666 length:399 start_codon:yes stop_codon:yes gene_type:complete
MWKKQWNKLKTALASPEEYVEEEQEEVEEEEEKAPEYNTDPVVEISAKDFAPLMATVESMKNLKMQLGEMLIRQEAERAAAVELNSKLNERMAEQIMELRSIYNVEPTVDYALNFPTEDGGAGSLVRSTDEE